MIRQLTEIVQETRRLRDRCKSCIVRVHHCPPPATQWITTDSALQPFVTLLFTRLPCAAPVTMETLPSSCPMNRIPLGRSKRMPCTGLRTSGEVVLQDFAKPARDICDHMCPGDHFPQSARSQNQSESWWSCTPGR